MPNEESFSDRHSTKEQTNMESGNQHPGEGWQDEEYAAEASPIPLPTLNRPQEEERASIPRRMNEVNRGEGMTRHLGWISLVVAVLSLFTWPAVLGPAAILLGFMSWFAGKRTMGTWSIALGVISFIAYVILAPLYS